MKISKTMFLKDWLDIWYETYAKPFVKNSTLVSYECYIRRHIKPYIGNIRLCDLNTITFQQFFNLQAADGNCRTDGNSTLSPKTLLNLRMMLHEAIADAVKNQLMSCNYVEYVKMPKQQHVERRVLTQSEQARLIQTLKASDDPFAFGVFLCLATGIRVGELCGLYWSDFTISESISTVQIQRTLGRLPNLETGKGTIIHISPPKSAASKRSIPLDSCTLQFLERYQTQQAELLGMEYTTGNHFLISRIPGKPVEPKFMQTKFKKFLHAAYIPDANFHALRHTFATRALECNVDYKTLSTLLGHANVTVTMNLYQHVLIQQKQNAICKIAQYLG